MNDRYLFRGKRKDNNEWVEGSLINCAFFNNDGFPIFYVLDTDNIEYDCWEDIAEEIDYLEVIPETVGQCTGLKDKNGTLIFERDIVESRASENQEDWKKWIVGFSDGSFCFNREIPKKRKRKYEENLLCVDEIELYGLTVIGNVTDNPELLEVER